MIWIISTVTFLIGVAITATFTYEHKIEKLQYLSNKLSYMEYAYKDLNNRLIEIENAVQSKSN